MASIHNRGGVWWLSFRAGGRQVQRSLKTADEKEARAAKARVEHTVRNMQRGWLVMPDGADLWSFVSSDGKLTAPLNLAPAPPSLTLAALWDAYFASQVGQKEGNTLATEQGHRRRLGEHFGDTKTVASLTTADVQGYVVARTGAVGPATIRKEVASLRMVLNRCERLTAVAPPDPKKLVAGVEYPKTADSPDGFLTWGEIEPRAAGPADPLWDRLFLTTPEVSSFLHWADGAENFQAVPYLPPLLTAAGHTGARLAELTRSRVEDWDFAGGTVVLREKKRTRTGDTYRRVPVSPRLKAAMTGWLAGSHPGGDLVFVGHADQRLTSQRAWQALTAFLRGSRWEVLKGYHILRHSFASNLAIAGVDQRVIDELMGHQTEAMRKRYRHFLPSQRTDAVNRLFPD